MSISMARGPSETSIHRTSPYTNDLYFCTRLRIVFSCILRDSVTTTRTIAMANARRLTRPQGENDLTESALRQANHELRQLVDFLPQHVIVLNADGTLIHANQTLLDFFGRTLEEMQGAGTTERVKRDVHPDDLERVQSERKNGFSKRTTLERDKRLLAKDR